MILLLVWLTNAIVEEDAVACDTCAVHNANAIDLYFPIFNYANWTVSLSTTLAKKKIEDPLQLGVIFDCFIIMFSTSQYAMQISIFYALIDNYNSADELGL